MFFQHLTIGYKLDLNRSPILSDIQLLCLFDLSIKIFYSTMSIYKFVPIYAYKLRFRQLFQ